MPALCKMVTSCSLFIRTTLFFLVFHELILDTYVLSEKKNDWRMILTPTHYTLHQLYYFFILGSIEYSLIFSKITGRSRVINWKVSISGECVTVIYKCIKNSFEGITDNHRSSEYIIRKIVLYEFVDYAVKIANQLFGQSLDQIKLNKG